MDKKLYLIIPVFISIIAISIYFIAQNEQKKYNQDQISIDTNSDKLICKINGAVLEEKEILVARGTTIREAIAQIILDYDADLSKVNLDKIIEKDIEINIPYLKSAITKLRFSEFNNIYQLTKSGISKKIAQKILNLKDEIEGIPTWKDIDQIEGIGIKTLEKLKKIIILD